MKKGFRQMIAERRRKSKRCRWPPRSRCTVIRAWSSSTYAIRASLSARAHSRCVPLHTRHAGILDRPDSPYHKPIFAEDKRFVFYCAGGWRSALAAKTAHDMGLEKVAHVGGGFGAWREAGGRWRRWRGGHRRQVTTRRTTIAARYTVALNAVIQKLLGQSVQ